MFYEQQFPFPESLVFNWTFVVVLLAFLVTAAYLDFRYIVVPKWITIPLAVLGLIMSIIRGGMLGGEGRGTLFFSDEWFAVGDAGSIALGCLDGFLFSLSGFLVAFGMFFAMFALGAIGGADVKLFTAEGAWLGPLKIIYVLIFTVFVLVVFSIFRLIKRVVTGGVSQATKDFSARKSRRAKTEKEKKQARLMTFSLPLAVATGFFLIGVYHVELGLSEPRATPTPVENRASEG